MRSYSLQATVTATSGGYKYVSGSYLRTHFDGKTASLTASMTFDLDSPTHCADHWVCVDGWGPAVDVGPEFDRSVSIFYFVSTSIILQSTQNFWWKMQRRVSSLKHVDAVCRVIMPVD